MAAGGRGSDPRRVEHDRHPRPEADVRAEQEDRGEDERRPGEGHGAHDDREDEEVAEALETALGGVEGDGHGKRGHAERPQPGRAPGRHLRPRDHLGDRQEHQADTHGQEVREVAPAQEREHRAQQQHDAAEPAERSRDVVDAGLGGRLPAHPRNDRLRGVVTGPHSQECAHALGLRLPRPRDQLGQSETHVDDRVHSHERREDDEPRRGERALREKNAGDDVCHGFETSPA